MSPALLAPVALAALLALTIPVLIHIARRTESISVDFAALRWLDREATPRRRLRIDERRLLVLRLLLLALIALWLARPVLLGVADERRVVAILPGVPDEQVAEVARDGDRLVWLAAGFPERAGLQPARPENPAALIRRLDAGLAADTPIDIVVPETLEGVDAERPRLSRPVGWHVAPSSNPTTGAAPPVAPPAIVVRHDARHEGQARYLRAVARSWTAPDDPPAYEAGSVDQPLPRAAEHLIWLSDQPLPEAVTRWVRGGGVAVTAVGASVPADGEPVVVWRDAGGEPLALEHRLGRGRVVSLTRALEPATLPALLEPDFPDALARILRSAPPPARVAASEHAPLTGLPPWPDRPADLRPWLALLIALLFAAERWMATRPSRAIVP